VGDPPAASRSDAVRAAGGVLWRLGPAGVEVALVHRPRYDDWSLPKGKLDPGELAVVAARREVEEETGFGGVVGRALGASQYVVTLDGRQTPKTVRWWAMRCTTGAFVPNREVDVLRWLSVEDAVATLTRTSEAEPLHQFAAGPPDCPPLLLLRHGSAGDRATWTGDDTDRPLDDVGREQAAAASEVLPLFGPTRVVTAPPERCAATVRPLALRLGLPLEVEPRVGADGWAADPDAAERAVRRLTANGPVVVCSQGEVLPDLLRRLGVPGDPPHGKGSLWSVVLDGDRLLDADHTADLRA
jgi:8-oxo-dGTP pyrophosphatase MutT (NUDIX family)/phosphohistidine phosphatase SixA